VLFFFPTPAETNSLSDSKRATNFSFRDSLLLLDYVFTVKYKMLSGKKTFVKYI